MEGINRKGRNIVDDYLSHYILNIAVKIVLLNRKVSAFKIL
jgi:hypothetical protein